jgi:hypothetical protein
MKKNLEFSLGLKLFVYDFVKLIETLLSYKTRTVKTICKGQQRSG